MTDKKKIVTNLDLDDIVFATAKKEACITIKDHQMPPHQSNKARTPQNQPKEADRNRC